MAKLLKKMAILAAVEATANLPVTPVAADAILVSDVTLTPIEGDVVQRNNIRPFFGSSGSTLVTVYRKVSFSVEFAGVANPGDLPGYAALLRGCAMSVTNEAGVATTFAPVTDDLETLTIYGNVDGINHKMHGTRGTVQITVDAKGIPKFQFEFTGSFVPATDEPLPPVNYGAFVAPLGVNAANSTLLLDGLSVACSAFQFTLGNQVVKRDLMNVDTVEITDRASTGTVTFENTAVAVKDWIGLALESAIVPLTIKHGHGATNTITITSTRAQVGKPTYSDSDGIQMIQVPLSFIPSDAGNDEWSIVV
jgi:hypothetical protein